MRFAIPRLLAVTVVVVGGALGGGAASAAPVSDYVAKVKGPPPPLEWCAYQVGATVCFDEQRDDIWVKDEKADGKGAVGGVWLHGDRIVNVWNRAGKGTWRALTTMDLDEGARITLRAARGPYPREGRWGEPNSGRT